MDIPGLTHTNEQRLKRHRPLSSSPPRHTQHHHDRERQGLRMHRSDSQSRVGAQQGGVPGMPRTRCVFCSHVLVILIRKDEKGVVRHQQGMTGLGWALASKSTIDSIDAVLLLLHHQHPPTQLLLERPHCRRARRALAAGAAAARAVPGAKPCPRPDQEEAGAAPRAGLRELEARRPVLAAARRDGSLPVGGLRGPRFLCMCVCMCVGGGRGGKGVFVFSSRLPLVAL
jgi:hypothetical protein